MAASLDDITDSLAETKSARKAAQESASRAARAADRSEQKAIRAAAAEEQRAAARVSEEARKQLRAELKAAKALAAQTKKADKRADKVAAAAAKRAPKPLFERATDPRTARRLLAIVKVIGPAVAPFALKAATSTREYLDNRRAGRLGVAAAEVGAFRGPTGSVEARLAGLKRGVDELQARRTGDLQVTRFSEVASGRLTDLTAAVRAAASMPPDRRRDALAAVSRELNQIDADLMTFLVGR